MNEESTSTGPRSEGTAGGPVLAEFVREACAALAFAKCLDQKGEERRGLTKWSEVGLEPGSSRLRQLDRIYRCSREVYAFLFDLNEVLGLRSQLVPPRDVDRFSSASPAMALAKDRAVELAWIAETIDRFKSAGPAASVVVVVPPAPRRAGVVQELRAALDHLGLPSREAHGEDMRESVERVMITDCESVVGLEFDAVFIPQLTTVWPTSLDANQKSAFWVAATRAKRFIGLSSTGSFPRWLGDGGLGGVRISKC